MDEVADVFSDQFQINTSAYSVVLNFLATKPTPPPPGSPAEADRVATVRMSLEHLKVMTYILKRQIMNQERDTGISYDIPRQVLNALQISPEDWDSFWRQG